MLNAKQQKTLSKLYEEVRNIKVTSQATERWRTRTAQALQTALAAADGAVEDLYREAAIRAHHVDGHLEIDTDAVVSLGCEKGAYVQAWVWVSDEEV